MKDAKLQSMMELYMEHNALCKQQIRRCAKVHKNLVVLDLREEQTIFAGNRFLIYALFPDTNISIHRTSNTNIGALVQRITSEG